MRTSVCSWLCALTAICVACGSDQPTEPPPSGSDAQIEVRYSSDITPAVQNAVNAAVAKWTRALSKDLGKFALNSPAGQCFVGEPALHETHHNLLLFVSILQMDGASGQLAFTQICGVSTRDSLPFLSHIQLDRADVDSMEARGVLPAVIMHELGHALGFNPKSYIPKGLASGGSNDPVFTGVAARSEFAKHGAWYTGNTVPLESSSGQGPMDPHWRFDVFGDELMVPVVGRDFKSPLSSITLGLFKDLGYNVDFSVSDPYEVAPLFGAVRVVPEWTLRNDVGPMVAPVFLSPAIAR
ncbi:MAG: leishmanolysin-related zinc metalloendopeptidase [Gemmatimonadales bacterium]